MKQRARRKPFGDANRKLAEEDDPMTQDEKQGQGL